ncbi:RagB/SusD family nutrient uptake outer membrane protein [Daejeonella oryzae]|uniref:RagB/SusD family nutrient uptake outer membrane protein n=1 Tax=Daejeonella oryzae TaxID=1122943 RepID=UPI000478A122|nr:RagB/SusD family nutrient uptake outer membrane protein [Daejeonella oryzae]
MKLVIHNIKIVSAALCVFLTLQFSSCKIDDSINPNNPSLEGALSNATLDDLNNLVVGTESSMRNNLGTYLDDVGVVGREIYRFSGSEPRFTSDLLGAGNAVLDNNTFYTTNPWASRYRTIKNTNILISAIENTSLPTEAQKQAYLGFANTIKAYQLLLVLNLSNDNGIRVDVADPSNLGPFVPKAEALTQIAALLESGFGQLNAAGATFPFQLSAGFAGFDNPDGFKRFNRGIAARVAVYRGQFAEALNFLNASFLNINGDFNSGVYHVFSGATGDQLNPVFLPLNSTGEVRVAQPAFRTDALAAGAANDDRLNKIALRSAPATQSGLTGTHDLVIFQSNTDPVSIIRNEELILIYAESKIRSGAAGYTDALIAINRIRQGHGLTAYSGALTETALINEMLIQRRYSLFMEGHRWIDMRRYNKLNELPIDRTGDDVWVSFPLPFSENAG